MKKRKVIQYDGSGNIVKTWPSLYSIETALGYKTGNIYACCTGASASSHGFLWRFEGDPAPGISERSIKERKSGYKAEKDCAEDFVVRAEAVLRAVYYAYKDMELTGRANHRALRDYVNCLLYNVLEAEKKIMSESDDNPEYTPPVAARDKEYTERFISSLNQFYVTLRSGAEDRAKEFEKEKKIHEDTER